jgi:hypothetical protein
MSWKVAGSGKRIDGAVTEVKAAVKFHPNRRQK